MRPGVLRVEGSLGKAQEDQTKDGARILLGFQAGVGVEACSTPKCCVSTKSTRRSAFTHPKARVNEARIRLA